MKKKTTKPKAGRATKSNPSQDKQKQLEVLAGKIKRAARNDVLLDIVMSNCIRTGEFPSPEVALDAHETLFHFVDPFCEYVADGRKSQNFRFDKVVQQKRIWNFSCDPSNDLTPYEFAEDFMDFSCLDRGGFSDLPIISNKIPGMLNRLHRGGRGYPRFTLHLWTDVPSFSSVHPNTGAWLESDSARFGTYKLVRDHKLPIAHERIEFYNPNQKVENMRGKGILVLVDDKDSTALKVQEIGRVCFVPKHPFNGKVNDPRVVYLDSIDQLEFAVRTFFNELYQALKERETVTGPLRMPYFADYPIS